MQNWVSGGRTARRAQAAELAAVMLAVSGRVGQHRGLWIRCAWESGKLLCATSALRLRYKSAQKQACVQWRRADAPRIFHRLLDRDGAQLRAG